MEIITAQNCMAGGHASINVQLQEQIRAVTEYNVQLETKIVLLQQKSGNDQRYIRSLQNQVSKLEAHYAQKGEGKVSARPKDHIQAVAAQVKSGRKCWYSWFISTSCYISSFLIHHHRVGRTKEEFGTPAQRYAF